jgi:hypothetical protein
VGAAPVKLNVCGHIYMFSSFWCGELSPEVRPSTSDAPCRVGILEFRTAIWTGGLIPVTYGKKRNILANGPKIYFFFFWIRICS